MDMIDLRSDTVTRPTPAMKAAMMDAPVGDDVFNDDPSINELQAKAAKLFNMEAGLFCSSGTQTNQIAIKAHTQPGNELICDKFSHIYNYEGGGIAFNAGVQARLVDGLQGVFTANQVIQSIQPNDLHYGQTKLVSIENTMNKGGGKVWSLAAMTSISEVCKANNLPLHLDGARIFNAIVHSKYEAAQIGLLFQSISICLSKGLGCPVGSLLLGSKDFIAKARVIRKVFGGGMRQAGILAAAGIYALDNNIDRLQLDHEKAQAIAATLLEQPYIESVIPVETNIIIFHLKPAYLAANLISFLASHQVLAFSTGLHSIRMVTHLDINAQQIDKLLEVLKKYS
jgi:threonine aldolase